MDYGRHVRVWGIGGASTTSVRAASARCGASRNKTGGVFWQECAVWRADGVSGVGILTDSHRYFGPRSVTPSREILHIQLKSNLNSQVHCDTGVNAGLYSYYKVGPLKDLTDFLFLEKYKYFLTTSSDVCVATPPPCVSNRNYNNNNKTKVLEKTSLPMCVFVAVTFSKNGSKELKTVLQTPFEGTWVSYVIHDIR